MPDCPKCTPPTRPLPQTDLPLRRRPLPVHFAVDPYPDEPSKRPNEAPYGLDSQTGYSIRIAQVAGMPCIVCGLPTGAGPVGFLDNDRICDRCLLDQGPDLGLVLALVSVVRLYSQETPTNRHEAWDSASQLLAFARIFERVARHWGPPRLFVSLDNGGLVS